MDLGVLRQHQVGGRQGAVLAALVDRGQPGAPSLPTTDDEIQEKYLERAIRELNQLTHRLQECSHCPRGNLMPVLGSGHPQADVFLLKYAPTAAEVEEGVAFYGRSGNALMKSFKRLGIDPLAVYGTLCVKCPVSDPSLAAGECVERVVEEIAIVQPRCIVVMGERALWWGGCAWDAFAIPNLVPDEPSALVATTCPSCGTPHSWLVTDDRPPEGQQVAISDISIFAPERAGG